MHRFFLPPADCAKPELFLTGREAHHARHVLRLNRRDRTTVLDGAGAECLCEVLDFDRDKIQLAVLERRFIPPLPCQITLLQAVPKGKIMETIIQKATELGVSRVVPLLTERVATRLDAESAADKAQKWQQVAVEACKQCGAAWLPKIETPVAPEAFLKRQEKFDLPLVASLQPGSRHARACFRAFQEEHPHPPQSACIWIGPEGDFTPEEVAAIQSGGALPITLGRLILRVETAAVYCLSVLNHELTA